MARLRSLVLGDRGFSYASVLDRAAQLATEVPRWVSAVILAVTLAVIWVIVYESGGSQRAFPHLFYIPIILVVLPFGWTGAAFTAVVAGVLCGPLMPLDTVTGEAQQTASWLLRSAMFLMIGGAAYLSVAVRRRADEHQLSSDVQEAITLSSAPGAEVDESLVPLIDVVLAERRFHPVYQPVYSLADARLLAVEALTRFDVEPYRTPDLWFAAAWRAGRGTDLEIAAIEEAILASVTLPAGVALSVNASPATLGEPRFLDLVRATERQLVVEITEHAVVGDYHLLQDTVLVLRALGVRIAVDDAGAGISSLRHIVQLAPETIKLDISLTQGVGTGPLRRALAGALIDFAQRIGAELIVEGIEEEGDLSTWTALGADAVQGFLVGRPGDLPFAQISALIASLRGARV